MAVPEHVIIRRAAAAAGARPRMKESMPDEQRRHTRYRVKDNVFAALTGPEGLVGKIRDLSMGGASFEFIPDNCGQAQGPQQAIDIFILGSTEVLPCLPCTIMVRESAPVLPGGTPASGNRTCVARFKTLPQAQARALLDFLMRYSVGFAA